MTDKEKAEEWCKENMDICKEGCGFGEAPYFTDEERCIAKSAFIDGFNADRWHYLSKGEYPPKGKQILAYAWNVHNVLAKYDTFDGKDRFVTSDAYNGFIEIKKVICWQYIIPPKEEDDDC